MYEGLGGDGWVDKGLSVRWLILESFIPGFFPGVPRAARKQAPRTGTSQGSVPYFLCSSSARGEGTTQRHGRGECGLIRGHYHSDLF